MIDRRAFLASTALFPLVAPDARLAHAEREVNRHRAFLRKAR